MVMEDLLLLKNVFFRGDHVDNLANYICTLVYLRQAYMYIWIQSLLWLSEIISNYWAPSKEQMNYSGGTRRHIYQALF